MSTDESIKKFRVASRELFNNFFHVPDPWNSQDVAWINKENFRQVESVLFKALVDPEPISWPGHAAIKESIALKAYKTIQPLIHVELRTSGVPIMINRDKEKESGYWDYPIGNITSDAVLQFVEFFDFDVLSHIDNKYVRVYISHWPSHSEAENRHALIDAQYVNFVTVDTSDTSTA